MKRIKNNLILAVVAVVMSVGLISVIKTATAGDIDPVEPILYKGRNWGSTWCCEAGDSACIPVNCGS